MSLIMMKKRDIEEKILSFLSITNFERVMMFRKITIKIMPTLVYLTRNLASVSIPLKLLANLL